MEKVKIKNNTIEFVFNLQNYPMEALYGTAYVFLDRAYLFLDNKTPEKINIFLKGKKKLTKKQLEQLKDDFLNELLNYTVRIKLTKNNKKIREFVVGQALFAALSNGGEEDEGLSYDDDPLGIAVPWEDKYGKETKKKK